MSVTYVNNVDFNKFEIRNPRVHNLGTAPSSPVAGQIYYNTADGNIYVWDAIGSAWVDLTVQGGSTTFAAPSNTIQAGNANAAGSAGTALRSDAVFAISTASAGTISGASAQGSSASLARADHDHALGSGVVGLTQLAAGVRLDSINAPTTAVALNSQRITGLADPSGSQDAATKNYVDSNLQGLTPKQAVRAATTGTLAANTYANGASGVGATLTGNANGALTVDAQTVGGATSQVMTGLTNAAGTYTATVASTNNIGVGQEVVLTGVAGFTTNPNGTWVVASVPSTTTFTFVAPTSTGTYTASSGTAVTKADRVLVKDEATAANNGIYVVTTKGTASTVYVLTRATDADNPDDFPSMYTWVEQGTTNADTGWTATVDPGVTVGTTNIPYTLFGSAGSFIAGNGLTKTGNTIDVVGTANRITVAADAIDISSSYVGQSTITTLGTITTGTWTGTSIAVLNGGTGATTAAGARTNLAAAGKFSGLIPGATAGTAQTITHNLNTQDVAVAIRRVSDNVLVDADVIVNAVNTITVAFGAVTSSGDYSVTVVG